VGMTGLKTKELLIGLLQSETERDKQRKVGASQISNPCTKHLAMALAGVPQEPSKYWLGGKIGTAVHLLIEDLIDKADLAQFPELEDCMVEQKIVLGELQDYGTVSSKPDLALVKDKHLIDWKTTKRDEAKRIQKWLDTGVMNSKTEYTMKKYMAQGQLYAWGLNNMGVEIETIALAFISRDGTNEADIVVVDFEYQEESALQLWTRLETLWDELRSGVHPESYAGDANCYNCAINGLV
jgi:hypothetical protein